MDDRSEEMKRMVEEFVSFPSYSGKEREVQEWVRDRFSDLGFEVYEWEPDADVLAAHPSFPPIETLELDDRPSIAGVLELGDPDAGPTVVLNGHADVVPVTEADWTSDPFEARWKDGDLYGRGALDMKSGLVASVFAARSVADRIDNLDGRIVVESVVGEEEGGIGAATAAANNPYPFKRDAMLIAEPSDLGITVAAEGSLMKQLTVFGKSAHAAKTWEGESVLPHFERIRRAFVDLEGERAERVTHPLFADFDNPWPVNFGTVNAGNWASSVPAELTSEIRIGIAPQETIDEVESEYQQCLDEIVKEDEWLRDHPPEFERFSVQFEGSEIAREEPIVQALAGTARENGIKNPAYEGSG